jgi:hypothetical protein
VVGQEDEPLRQKRENNYHLTARCGRLGGGKLLESVKIEDTCSGLLVLL